MTPLFNGQKKGNSWLFPIKVSSLCFVCEVLCHCIDAYYYFAHTHTHIHTQAHIHIHTHTHTHTHRYEECKTKLTPFLKKVGFNPKTDLFYIPVSGLTGVNLKDSATGGVCSWYR